MALRKPKEEFSVPHPRTRVDLLGHEETEASLIERFTHGRLPHALLITGTEGIGKATLAYRFARFVLSEGDSKAEESLFGEAQTNLHMSPQHSIFKRVLAGSHAGLLTIEPVFDERKGEYKKEIGVDEARKIAGFMSLTSAESAWRVVIVDSVDALNRNAANAILKILEEPPQQALLLLISHNPGSVLATIRSRCQALPLRPPEERHFHTIVSSIFPDVTQAQVRALRSLSNESPGIAIRLQSAEGLNIYNSMLEVLAARHAPLTVIQRFSESVGNGSSAEWNVLSLLISTLLTRIVRTAGGYAVEPLNDQEKEVLQSAAASKPLDYWLKLWEKAGSLLADTPRVHLDAKQVISQIFHAMVHVA